MWEKGIDFHFQILFIFKRILKLLGASPLYYENITSLMALSQHLDKHLKIRHSTVRIEIQTHLLYTQSLLQMATRKISFGVSHFYINSVTKESFELTLYLFGFQLLQGYFLKYMCIYIYINITGAVGHCTSFLWLKCKAVLSSGTFLPKESSAFCWEATA